MAYNILLTSLYEADKDAPICYYFAKEGNKKYYCDAMLTVEASTKYVLAQHPIDEIITLGRKLTYDEGDDKKLTILVTKQSVAEQLPAFIEEKTHLFHKNIEVQVVDAIQRNEAGKIINQ